MTAASRAFARFRKNRGALVGLGLVAALVLFALLGPLFLPSPLTPDFDHGRGPFGTPSGPSLRHPFGTDTVFRDVLSRLAHGGRLSLEVACLATLVSTVLGAMVGIGAGYFAGRRVRVDVVSDAFGLFALAVAALLALRRGGVREGVLLFAFAAFALSFGLRAFGRLRALLDRRAPPPSGLLDLGLGLGFAFSHAHLLRAMGLALASVVVRAALDRDRREEHHPAIDVDDGLMRLVDALLSFPFLLLAMAIAAAVDRTTEATLFLLLGLTAWTGNARVVRGKTLQIRSLEFVVAAQALGASTPRVLLRHVLPNVAGVLVVLGTSSVATMIVAEAALSFLGLSLPPPAPSWGSMLDEARPYFALAPWLLAAPAIAILLTVLGFNLLGEGLRDAFDPKE